VVDLKCLVAIRERLEAKTEAIQEAMEGSQEEMKAYQEAVESSQEKLEASQEKIEAMAKHYKWAPYIKVTHLVTTLQDLTSDVLHEVPKGVMYKETIKALEECFRNQQQATAYCAHLKKRTQLIGKPLQEFATAIKS
jgi:chromosome segregation ATPase